MVMIIMMMIMILLMISSVGGGSRSLEPTDGIGPVIALVSVHSLCQALDERFIEYYLGNECRKTTKIRTLHLMVLQ